MHEVVPALVHELTGVLVQFTYWPHPDGYLVVVPGSLPEGAAGELPSLVPVLLLLPPQVVVVTGVVPRR